MLKSKSNLFKSKNGLSVCCGRRVVLKKIPEVGASGVF